MSLDGLRILVVEDDTHVCELLDAVFRDSGADLHYCHDGVSGVDEGKRGIYDLIVLDLMVPQKNGFEVCRELRGPHGIETPILILTARTEEIDTVLGLELGADDYVTKPFSPRELLARCNAVLRRFQRSTHSDDQLFFKNGLEVDPLAFRCGVRGKRVDLTRREFELLHYLSIHPGQTLSRDMILEGVWGYDTESESRTVDEHVKRVRQKLVGAGLTDTPIRTVWGVGYQFDAEPADRSRMPDSSHRNGGI